ncbi:uncharacterized protein [Anomalospiza imberbis]|uniref:uncharacterized protein n=1 Tax=Anomalospiza imberbis TaxID=187417 RepID=UPI00358EBEEA
MGQAIKVTRQGGKQGGVQSSSTAPPRLPDRSSRRELKTRRTPWDLAPAWEAPFLREEALAAAWQPSLGPGLRSGPSLLPAAGGGAGAAVGARSPRQGYGPQSRMRPPGLPRAERTGAPFANPSGGTGAPAAPPRRPRPRGAPRLDGARTAHPHRARRGRSDVRLPRRSLLPSPSGPKMLNPCANLKQSPHAAVNCCPAHDAFHIHLQCLCTSPGGGDLQAWMCDSVVPPHGKLFLMLIPGCLQVLMTNSPASSDINPWEK